MGNYNGIVMSQGRFPSRLIFAAYVVLMMTVTMAAREEPTIDQLKERLSAAAVADKPKICVQIAQRQLAETTKLFAAADPDPAKTQAALTDVVAFSELARDYSIQSHKHEKQTEIAVRAMARKLSDMLHTLARDEQPPVKDAIQRLQRVRDDLLTAMFPKGAK